MRLTNPADQDYVRRLLPDALSVVTEALPTLEQREAVIIGDSISIPSIVRIDELVLKPNSHDVKFLLEWRRDWQDVDFLGVFNGRQGESAAENLDAPGPVTRIPAARPEAQVDLTSGESMPVDSADGPW
jgi:DNA helicase HerA-like ATPase